MITCVHVGPDIFCYRSILSRKGICHFNVLLFRINSACLFVILLTVICHGSSAIILLSIFFKFLWKDRLIKVTGMLVVSLRTLNFRTLNF